MGRYATAYGAFEIDSMPGQPQVAHCHGFFVAPASRGQGLAHKLKAVQNATLRQLGYDFATCTVAAENKAQIRVLEKAKWKKLGRFSNARMGGMTEVWGFNVNQ